MADSTGTISPKSGERVSFEGASNAKESRVFVGAPDYRVFVWGVEITPDVFGMQITQQTDDQLSTAQVHLVNDNEKWIMPTMVSLIGYQHIPDELSNVIGLGEESFISTTTLAGTTTQGLSSPKGPITNPIRFAQQKRENFMSSITQGNVLGKAGQALLDSFHGSDNFPFLPGSPLIQMNDPIRIFLKNPWNLSRKNAANEFDAEATT